MNKKQRIVISHKFSASDVAGSGFINSEFRFNIGVKNFLLVRREKYKKEERDILKAAMQYQVIRLMESFLKVKNFSYSIFTKRMKLRQSRKFWNLLINSGYEVVKTK